MKFRSTGLFRRESQDDQAGRFGSRARAIDLSAAIEVAEDGTAGAPVLIDSNDDGDVTGTRARPLMIEDAAHLTALISMDQLNALVIHPLYQFHRLRHLTPEQASPVAFRYAMSREELWKLGAGSVLLCARCSLPIAMTTLAWKPLSAERRTAGLGCQ